MMSITGQGSAGASFLLWQWPPGGVSHEAPGLDDVLCAVQPTGAAAESAIHNLAQLARHYTSDRNPSWYLIMA
jgi:hypothetical protein